MRLPLIIAHRGASFDLPENTLPAFEAALQTRADGIELDVWKCASGEIVVTHDRDLKRVTGIEGDIENKTLDELRNMNFAAFKKDYNHSEKIPTLDEVLDLIKTMSLINIEIKGKNIRGNRIERDVLKEVYRFKVMDQTLISSFNPAILRRVRVIDPRIKIGLIFYEGSSLPMRRAWFAKWLKPYSLHPSLKLLKAPWINRAHQKNQKVIAWTANHIHDLEECLRLEVDGIITDKPAWLADEVRKICH